MAEQNFQRGRSSTGCSDDASLSSSFSPDQSTQSFSAMASTDPQYLDTVLQGLGTNIPPVDAWSSYGGLLGSTLHGTSDGLSDDSQTLLNFYSNWGSSVFPSGADVAQGADPQANAQLSASHLDQYFASVGLTSSSQPGFFNSSTLYDATDTGLTDELHEHGIQGFRRSGHDVYAEAANQWCNVGLSGSDESVNKAQSVPTSGEYDPFGSYVFQPGLSNSESTQSVIPPGLNLSESASLPHHPPSPSSGQVPSSYSRSPGQIPGLSNATIPVHPQSPTSPVNSRPSYSEVAKNKPGPTSKPDAEKPKLVRESYKYPDGGFGAYQFTAGVGTYPSHGKTSHRRPRTGRHQHAGLTRNRSVPFEPSTISPNSRYGLDTFDDCDHPNKESELGTVPQSRKNSESSLDSGSTNGIEEIAEGTQKDKVKTLNSKEPAEPQCGSKRPKHSDPSANSSKDTSHVFFDPKRIFAPRKKRKNSGSTWENEISNKDCSKTYVPNNQQSSSAATGVKNPDTSETVLNNGKPKNSYMTNSNINQSCYINNDLRDPRKQTNTESSNTQPARPSEETTKTSAAAPRGRRRKEEVPVSPPRPRRMKKEADGHNVFVEYVSKAVEWLCWAVLEVTFILWNLTKLALSVAIFLLFLAYRLVSFVCCWLYNKTSQYIPFLSSSASSYSSGNASGRSRSHGLKENIPLPATGDEAMKRLLSCRGKDAYSILGLRHDATDEEIKRYYRRQAVLVHPDKNQQPGAEEAFKILGHAFELVGEPDKRRSYDAQRFEDQETEQAMQEFADLLTKLHDKMQEAANLMRCEHCGGKHRRIPVDRPTYSARFCDRCSIRHPAREGDVWAESRVMGFLWNYYACMEGKVYDITEWASCQREHFQHIQANAHHIIYRISTSGNRSHHQSARNTSKEAELEDFLNNLFHNNSQDIPDGFKQFASANQTTAGSQGPGHSSASNTSSSKSAWSSGTGPQASQKRAGGRRKKRKH